MIASWALFSLAIGCVLTLAAAAADRLASLFGRPRRFIWLACMSLTACWPVLSLISAALFSRGASASSSAAKIQHLPTLTVIAPTWEIPRSLGLVVAIAWILCSVILLTRLVFSFVRIRQRQASWPEMEIDGIRVRVSTTAGPAVVGFRPMNVVLPAWVLEMEPSARDLVLRHEQQHREARDPYLLLAATLITALVPWNLPLWIQARRLRLTIEIDCDQRVLGGREKWRPYALLLLAIAQRKKNIATQMVPALFTSNTNLEQRINAMRTNAMPSRLQAAGLTFLTAAAVTVACAVNKPESPNHPNGQLRTTKEEPAATPTFVPESASLREFQVEGPAILQEAPPLQYPTALTGSGITGEVVVQFVVDQTGRADITTFKLLKSPDPRLTAEVKAAVPTWRFTAATVGGKKVKQLVEQSVAFTTEKGTVSVSTAPKR